MAKTAVATQAVDFEAIDRLEEKLKLLIGGASSGLRGDNARATDEIAPPARRARRARARGSPKPKAPAPSWSRCATNASRFAAASTTCSSRSKR